ncbi:cyclin domain-containing protein [Lichtheimia hyalospora FSU 10163]|nr:cyclin domain-containing protein [Lichtheimia hyalospora FSU 10163]
MESPTTSTVCSRSPEALLSFTTNTATSILPCSKKARQQFHPTTTRPLPPLGNFIANLFQRSELPPSVCLVSLIYLQRLKAHLPPYARGNLDTPYRLFLAAIITASKFMLESTQSLSNQKVAAMIDYVYSPKDINAMERSFLGLLKFDLFVNLDAIKDYLAMHGPTLEMDLVENTF